MSNLFTELKRRNVFRVAMAYVVISWLVLQVANTIIPILELSPDISKTILLLLFLGFIPAIFFSWAFEITPEGIKKEKDVLRDESITNLTAKKMDYITLIAAFGVVGLFVWEQMNPIVPGPIESQVKSTIPEPEAKTKISFEKTIAVLPFVNMSGDTENEYFSDGITEEILNALATITHLKVASRTTSFTFKNSNENLRAVGEKLRVEHILEGSVRKQGEQVRITAQLIQASNDIHLWSETYDGSLENIFDLQEKNCPGHCH